MRLLALSLVSMSLTATAATAQMFNGTASVPSTLAGQNVGAVNGRSSGFATAGRPAVSAERWIMPRVRGVVRRVLRAHERRVTRHRRQLGRGASDLANTCLSRRR